MAPTVSRRSLRPIALVAALVATAVAPTAVQASSYGKLIARHDAAPATPLQTSFANVAAPKAFLLVVTEPAAARLDFSWSVRCTGGSRHRESGGASGAATVPGRHWVKRVVVSWIKHPTSCTGSVTGTAAASPVLVRVFEQ
jgi:hypothetical protein